MPHCRTCAAPLAPYTTVCSYCGNHNEIDLAALGTNQTKSASSRRCPVCQDDMLSVQVNSSPDIAIEQCPAGDGLFFDADELDALLSINVAHVYSINHKLIASLNQHGIPENRRDRTYIHCPVCTSLMNRVNYGSKSGVVIDQCIHGIWLDSGELSKLLEWRKAGGALLHEQLLKEKSGRQKTIALLHGTGSEMVFSSVRRPLKNRHTIHDAKLLRILDAIGTLLS